MGAPQGLFVPGTIFFSSEAPKQKSSMLPSLLSTCGLDAEGGLLSPLAGPFFGRKPHFAKRPLAENMDLSP